MTRIFRHRNLISPLLVLVYLLIGSGMGNVLLLCQESEASSHLEYALAGKCQDGCLAEAGRESHGCTSASRVWSTAANCLDTPVSLSHVSARVESLLGDTVASDWSAFPFAVAGDYPVTELKILNLVAQPPPPQVLAVLRTVVLLN